MGGISYNVWLCGLCAGASWFRLLCFPAALTDDGRLLLKHVGASMVQRSDPISAYYWPFLLICSSFFIANLCVANLCIANLCIANLCTANLCIANLCVSNLSVANLCVSNLSVANLCS
jgi:hypothetical protein